ncbi:hypothetical protein EON63_10605 [archaeon]|nr:MAG: hypothetical protein EON63_10605 [archaeon]
MLIRFIREVCTYSSTNNMDAHNLSIVFAPTIFRSGVTDPIRAVMEVSVLMNNVWIRYCVWYAV